MPTQFTATVKPSGGDYTYLNAAVTGLANDITAADIMVFSISAYSIPTIAAGDTVLGQSSLATGVCVLVNAARTQILIKTIAVASFLSGEIVQKTSDANVRVTLSNVGDSPIIGIECYSMSDTTEVIIWYGNFTTSTTNYIYIYTPISERHNGKWDDTKYRLEIIGSTCLTTNNIMCIKIEGLQMYNTTGLYNCISIIYSGVGSQTYIDTCILRGNDQAGEGILAYYGDGTITIQNCLAYDNGESGFSIDTGGLMTIRNCTSANNKYGFYNTNLGGTITCTNCLSYNNTTAGFGGTITATYSASSDATVPVGTGNRNSQVFSFVNPTGTPKDFHLTYGDTGARNYGTNLSAYFTTDINGNTRPPTGSWDIGADQYIFRHSQEYIIM